MMQSVQEVAEEARRSNDLLREIKDAMGDVLRDTQHAADVRANPQRKPDAVGADREESFEKASRPAMTREAPRI